MSRITHEVCIVGAGPVGLALANCLSRSPLITSIALIDRKLPRVMPAPYALPNQRVFSINAPILQFLERIGALQRVRQFGKLEHIQVMSKESGSFIQWDEKAARIIENDELVSALLQNLQQNKTNCKIDFIEDQIQTVSNDNYSHCQVGLKQSTIHTKLLVGSDGNKSKVKQLAGIPTYGWSYRQKAIACTLAVEGLTPQINTSAYQIYHDSNILGVLPLWNNYLSIVWSLQLADFEHVMQLPDEQFVASLNALLQQINATNTGKPAFKPLRPFSSLANKRLAFPLNSLQAENYAKHRLALVGDAAHSIHPMAGLGVNSGILDSILLANNIIANKKTGNDIGEGLSLGSFQANSKAMNYGNSMAMQSIKKIFEVDCSPLNILRKTLLNFSQESSTIKGMMRGVVEKNPLVNIPRYEWEH